MESAEARKMCIDAKADNIEDIIVVNAANRPGTKDNFPIYCKNKLSPETAELVHDDLRPIFQRTQGVLLYQEQALQIFRYAGFPEEEVDNARRCVDEHTWIMLSNGDYKEIKDINIGEQVMCLDEQSNKITYRPVLNKFDNQIKQVYKIKLGQSEELVATKEHKVLTQDGWKEIQQLTVNDYIMKPKVFHPYKDNIPANKKPHFKLMYLYGLLIGDGCLGNKYNIHFTNSEEILIEEYQKCVGYLLPRNPNCEFNILKQLGVEVEYVYSVRIKSKNFSQKLIEQCKKYDLLHKASDKNITKFMDYPPNKLIQGLLAGMYNTDGGYNIQCSAIEYYSTSKLLAYQISSLLLKFKIKSYVYSKKVIGYDYDCYTVVIKNTDSICLFDEIINRYVIGRKHNDYKKIVELAKAKKYGSNYNYILPQKFAEEIRDKVNLYECQYTELSKYISNGAYEVKVTHSGITDTKASNIIKNIYCPETYKLLTSEYYPVRIKSIEYVGERHVYDLEIEEHHNYIANNLIVHNCIGKKQKDKMAELEVKFRDGLTKKGWTEEQQTSIWNLMLKQAEYSFNLGHASAYGLLSYLTAYLKTHYPLEFFAALLTAKSDRTEKMSIIIDDCKKIGIKVLPPNINRSDYSFTINKKNNEILFGLMAVKGIGESIVQKIIDNRPYNNLDDFINKVNDKTAIITLIKAGATPSKNKMKSLKHYADNSFPKGIYKPITTLPTYPKLIDMGFDLEQYRIGTKKYDYDKVKLLTDYNKQRETEFNEVQHSKHQKYMTEFYEKYAQNEFLWEFETLSMFITNDPLKQAYQYITVPWNEVREDEKAVLCCVITDIKRKKDKNGNQFAYLDLYTPFGIIEATIWSSQLKDYSDLIKKGNCLAIKGRKREGNHFFVEKVKPYTQWLSERK